MKHKYYLSFLLLLFFHSCSSSKNDNKKVELEDSLTPIILFDSLFENIKPTTLDSLKNIPAKKLVIKPYTGDTLLSGGYHLNYKVYKDTIYHGFLQSLSLVKDAQTITVISESSYPMTHRYLGYILADFDDFFLFTNSIRGSYPPIWTKKIKKKNGEFEYLGLYVTYDKNENVLLTIHETINDLEKDTLYMYDFNKNVTRVIDSIAPDETLLKNCSPIGLRTCIEFDTITDNYIILTTNKADKTSPTIKIYR